MKKHIPSTLAAPRLAKKNAKPSSAAIGPSVAIWLLVLSTLLLCSCRSGPAVSQGEDFNPTPAFQPQTSQQAPYPSLGPPTADQPPQGFPREQAARGFVGDAPQAAAGRGTKFNHPSQIHLASHLELTETNSAQLIEPPQTSYGPEYTYRVQAIQPLEQQSVWAPPEIKQSWPRDEYLLDGGDRALKVEIDEDWTVRGIDQEDTVAHFDTLDGDTYVQASNSVAIYSPRFASVRKVHNILQHEQHQSSSGVGRSDGAIRFDESQSTKLALRQANPVQSLGSKAANSFLDQQRGIGLENIQILFGLTKDFRPYEDFRIIRDGQFDNSEKARLAKKTQAAFAWAGDQIVQVVLDKQSAQPISQTQGSQLVVHYELPSGKSRMRVVKVASKDHARPGEIIDFTIRFDNHGDQDIGNVTLIDNLTTRLEYVPNSAESSLKAEFLTQENDGGSLVLRWEIAEPLKVGEGGVIRFQCRVR